MKIRSILKSKNQMQHTVQGKAIILLRNIFRKKANLLKKTIMLLALLLILTNNYNANAMSFFNKNSSKQADQKPIKAPTSIPIDITKKGNRLEFLVEITKEEIGDHFELEFEVNDPRNTQYTWGAWIKSFFVTRKPYTKEELKDLDRVRKLVGGPEWENNKRTINPGVPTPIHLTVTKLENNGTENIIFDKVVEEFECHKSCIISGCYKEFPKFSFKNAGIYKVQTEALRDSPELIGTKINLHITYGRARWK